MLQINRIEKSLMLEKSNTRNKEFFLQAKVNNTAASEGWLYLLAIPSNLHSACESPLSKQQSDPRKRVYAVKTTFRNGDTEQGELAV